MRSPFSRKVTKANSFTNGPNTEQRSVWIGGATLVARGRVEEEEESESLAKRFPRHGESSEDDVSSTNSRSSNRGLFNTSTGDNNNTEQRLMTTSLIHRIKALSPRRGTGRDDNADDEEAFFSPESTPPSASEAPKNRKTSVSIGGETIIGDGAASSLSPSNRRTRRSHVTARRKRSSSTRNSRQLFSSVTSVDIPSVSSLDETEVKHRGESSHVEEGLDLEAALIPKDDDSLSTTPSRVGSKRKQYNEGQRRVSIAEGHSLYLHNRQQQQLQADNITGIKRRRLSQRARTRLTMREVNSNIQPGRSYSALEDSMGALEKRKAISLPRAIDFFLQIEMKLIAVNTMISVILTVLVMTTFPDSWKTGMKESSLAVSLLGAFLSFALVFRTQTCYNRWWEARTQWGKMTATCVKVAGQSLAWFADEDLIDRFLTHCIVFPYACKAFLRGNALNSSPEEGSRLLQSGILTDADLGVIVRHGFAPFSCIEIMRRIMHEALLKSHSNHYNQRRLPPEALNGALLAMEQSFSELYFNFGACCKINSTRMPASYTVFMRSFVLFFFILASLSWAPRIKFLTPIITGFMVFLINTVIVIGDQMMRPFTLTWSGLPLQKFCVIIENEIHSVAKRRADIERTLGG